MSTTRPLPVIEIRKPKADRGAEDVRSHLDARACALCGCPDVEEVIVELPWTGRSAYRPVCKGHPEHPDHPGFVKSDPPTDYRWCGGCGDLGRIVNPNRLCFDCRVKSRS